MKNKNILLKALVLCIILAQVSPVFAGNISTDNAEVKTLNDPETVISNYLKAVGGKDNIAKIKNSVITMEADFQGTVIKIKGISDSENERMVQETSIMGNIAQRTVLANGKATLIAMGQEQVVPEDMIQSLKAQVYVFPEEHYQEMGYDLELQGTEDIEGEEAHKLVITTSNNMKTVEYYSVASGLKLRTSSDAAGDITYSDYEEVDGVKFPMKMTIKNPMMPMALETKVTSLEFNQELSDEDFK
ncbi:peptidase, M16 family protein [Mongoliibacter sp.]|uniref:peptidase, M16 family protein n=1 Tax=Mongoliibacter sp. TaxID=2022438 RepID=UPI0025FA25F2|nr:peptidase, M16 family protein [Mongoliibacter sp.]